MFTSHDFIIFVCFTLERIGLQIKQSFPKNESKDICTSLFLFYCSWFSLFYSNLSISLTQQRQESNDYCRRLKFTDIMATTHQRLVKYPLLLDQINKSTPSKHPDYADVEQSSRCCREILNHVNDEIKAAEDIHR